MNDHKDFSRTLRYAARWPAAARKESFSQLTRHLFLSAQARLGNMPGYYRSSLAGLNPGDAGLLGLRNQH
jgi:hypothetical protein